MKVHRIVFVSMAFLLTVSAVWSSDLTATIQEISGKVEVMKSDGVWQPVKVGDHLSAGDTISTGFNSKAVMVLGNTSVLVAKDLTRLTLKQLYDKEGTVVTDLFLNVGKVRSEVHSSDAVKNNFQVRNANTTASVRGTVLDVEILGDGQGMKVMAWKGMAAVSDLKNGRTTYVGERKKKKGSAAAGSSADMAEPSDPPESIAASAVITSTAGSGIVSSMSSAMNSSSVTVDTKPPSPDSISVAGGSSLSPESVSAALSASAGSTTAGSSSSAESSVTIDVVWPE